MPTDQPGHGLVDRLDAGAHGVDLAGQPRQAFTAVGLGAGGGHVGAFGFGGDAFALGEFGAGGLQPGARFGQLVEQLPLLGRRPLRPGPPGLRGRDRLEVSGSASRCCARSLAMRTVALTRSASADSRNQVCWAASARSLRLSTAASCAFSSTVLASSRVASSSCSRRSVVSAWLVFVELGLAGDQVVGGQPQPGVAQVGLDGLGATGHLGLAAQRLELAAQLGRQVGQPGQVGRHRVELADRLFLALAVLEHAGGFLDERAPVLRPRFEDLGELALADDDVHLAADAGVGEQLLHIHQTATGCR